MTVNADYIAEPGPVCGVRYWSVSLSGRGDGSATGAKTTL